MQPKPAMECKTHEILKARMKADLKVYRDAVVQLDQSSGLDFKKAHQRAEHMRLAYESSRDKLDEHINSHHCG